MSTFFSVVLAAFGAAAGPDLAVFCSAR